MGRVPIIRVQQFSKGSLSAIGREVDRAEKRSRNADIDPARSELNVMVKEAEGGTLYRAWQQWRADHGCAEQKISKSMTAFEGMVLTASPEVFRDLGWDKDNPTSAAMMACEELLMKQYEFVCEKIGEDRILSATIHFDETTPHMQLYYVPAVDFVMQKQYARDEAGKILRNDKGSPLYQRDAEGKIVTERVDGVRINRGAFWTALGGKNSYNTMQTEHFNHMNRAFPELELERGQEGSTAEHRTKNQWEMEQLDEQILNTEAALINLESDVALYNVELENAAEKLGSAEDELADVEAEKAAVLGDLAALKDVLTKSLERVSDQLGGKEEVERQMAAANQKIRDANELKQLRSFVNQPHVKPLWEQFQHPQQEVERSKKKKSRPLVR